MVAPRCVVERDQRALLVWRSRQVRATSCDPIRFWMPARSVERPHQPEFCVRFYSAAPGGAPVRMLAFLMQVSPCRQPLRARNPRFSNRCRARCEPLPAILRRVFSVIPAGTVVILPAAREARTLANRERGRLEKEDHPRFPENCRGKLTQIMAAPSRGRRIGAGSDGALEIAGAVIVRPRSPQRGGAGWRKNLRYAASSDDRICAHLGAPVRVRDRGWRALMAGPPRGPRFRAATARPAERHRVDCAR
jgi:hypothetical protein